MSTSKITVDPVTRIEGHMKVEAELDDGRVAEARCGGTMARGLELIFRDRDPRDIPILAQRICGVCPQAHATASAMAMDEAFGLRDRLPRNGVLLRDIMLGANFLQSHVLHFFHLGALDYVDVTAAAAYGGGDADLEAVSDFIDRGVLAPFTPRYEGDYRLSPEQNLSALKSYVEALQVRKNCHELLSLFGGKMPHQCTVNVGGVTTQVTADKVVSALSYLREIEDFVERHYIPTVLAVAGAYPDYLESGAGCGRFLSYGVFSEPGLFDGGLLDTGREALESFEAEKVTEDVAASFYEDDTNGLHPGEGETRPEPQKPGAYSWLKAPRYEGRPCEVGPLARMLVNYEQGNETIRKAVDSLCDRAGIGLEALNSTLGRHACRALETAIVARQMQNWLMKLQPGEPCVLPVQVPEQGAGAGLTDAPRGALGHWVRIENGKVANYQAVVPTTWNGSPRDAQGTPGPIEQALEGQGVEDADNPFEIVRTIRSFDPCLACSVHVARPKGETIQVRLSL